MKVPVEIILENNLLWKVDVEKCNKVSLAPQFLRLMILIGTLAVRALGNHHVCEKTTLDARKLMYRVLLQVLDLSQGLEPDAEHSPSPQCSLRRSEGEWD